MQEVTAWKDNSGAIHSTKTSAAGADLVLAFEHTWEQLPTTGNKGDAKEIASFLMANIKARNELWDALESYDDALRIQPVAVAAE